MSIINTTVHKDSYASTLTVDCAIFGFQKNELKLLLVKRSIEPFKGFWLLPGGIMGEGQTLEEAVTKVLFNLTGIQGIHQEQVKCYSAVDRHPIKRVITVSFYALIKPENYQVIAGSEYVSDVNWFPVASLPTPFGFDHEILFKDALEVLRRDLTEKLLFRELLPKKFTLKELQDLYESILGQQFDRRNFRKKILLMDLIEETGEKKSGVKGGPELYTLKALSQKK